MSRQSIILKLINDYQYKNYLEIGCRYDEVFSVIPISKVGVDPVSGGNVRTTSDEYFKKLDLKVMFDIVFIDGLHQAEQVYRDIENALKHLNAEGTIVIHDANPQFESAQVHEPQLGTWNGDVWKAIVHYRQNLDINIVTFNDDHGCAIIKKKPNNDPIKLDKNYMDLKWEDLVKNRQSWLRLDTVEGTFAWLNKMYPRKEKTIGSILPHIQQYGGVRRFLEIGNEFVKRGYDYTTYVNSGNSCSWMEYSGKFKDWKTIDSDIIIIGDPPSFRVLPEVKGEVYVYVISRLNVFLPHYIELYKQNKYKFIVNNQYLKQFFSDATIIEGGVNTSYFTPRKKRIAYYAYGAQKGSDVIQQQLGGLSNVELVPFKGMVNSKLRDLYKTCDWFVSWEQEGGWSNTTAEALASGLPVVTNGMNCEPFLHKCVVVKDLRKFFENPMEEFSWKTVVDKLMKLWGLQ